MNHHHHLLVLFFFLSSPSSSLLFRVPSSIHFHVLILVFSLSCSSLSSSSFCCSVFQPLYHLLIFLHSSPSSPPLPSPPNYHSLLLFDLLVLLLLFPFQSLPSPPLLHFHLLFHYFLASPYFLTSSYSPFLQVVVLLSFISSYSSSTISSLLPVSIPPFIPPYLQLSPLLQSTSLPNPPLLHSISYFSSITSFLLPISIPLIPHSNSSCSLPQGEGGGRSVAAEGIVASYIVAWFLPL